MRNMFPKCNTFIRKIYFFKKIYKIIGAKQRDTHHKKMQKGTKLISIICPIAPLSGGAIRVFLKKVGFVPQGYRQSAAMAFLYPCNHSHRRAISQLSLMERVSRVQKLGFASLWRVERRFTWLSYGVIKYLNGQKIVIYHAERLSDSSRLFFTILKRYTKPETINLVFGHASGGLRCECKEESFIESSERLYVDLLSKNDLLFSSSDCEDLMEYGKMCMHVSNFWQANLVFSKLLAVQPSPQTHQLLASTYRFFKHTVRAEWHYLKALEEGDPQMQIESCYSIAILYLRHHPKTLRSPQTAKKFIERASRLIGEENLFSRKDSIYLRSLLASAESLALFREKKLSEALTVLSHALEKIKSLPESEVKDFLYVHGADNMGQVCSILGRIDDAISWSKQAMERDKNNPLWPVSYGKNLIRAQKFSQAAKLLQEASLTHHDSADIHALLGSLYLKIGQAEAAQKSYEKACACDPDNTALWKSIDIAQQKKRDAFV